MSNGRQSAMLKALLLEMQRMSSPKALKRRFVITKTTNNPRRR
jgi:hypothetical protein